MPPHPCYISGSKHSGTALITIKTYSTPIEAASAKIALDAAGIPCVVVGVGVSMEGGMGGVQLQVPPDQVDTALAILGDA